MVRGTADPSAALGMTKGKATLPKRAVAREQLPGRTPSVQQPLFAALERAACAVFCKENRMEFATLPTLTGNPGQPRDLQF
jgi:hypothetical protein